MSTAKSMLQESSSNSANIYLVLQIKNASLSVTFYVMEILSTVASSAAGCVISMSRGLVNDASNIE